jgi:transcriptional regulator with XRE-family HTH domain
MATPHRPPLSVRRVLKKLGQDIRDARRRQGLPAEVVADRAFTSRPTLRRIEAGDYSVSIGIYASVLQALGLLDGLGELAEPSKDKLGMALSSEKLPQRVRMRRPRKETEHEQ